MTLKYESELLFDLMKRDGENAPSDVLPYESELKEKYLNQVIGAYPKLQDYRAEWLNYALDYKLPSDFPIVSVTNVTSASFNNVVPYTYQSAILKGNTLINLAQPSLRAWTMNAESDTASLKATTEEFIIDWSKGVPFNAWITATNNNSPVFGGMLKADTDYTFIIRILENNPTFEGVTVTSDIVGLQMWGLTGYAPVRLTLQAGVTGTLALKYKFNRILTTQNNENIFGIAVGGTAVDGTKFIDGGKLRISKDIIILEGDYTNNYQDIPYFEGMQSVKMPVLTTSNEDGTKTIILTVNEDVTLRSNGSVCDELDLLTGKLTQRIDEDGSVLTQEVVKIVDLSCINEQGESETFRPIEGTMHVSSSSQTLPPLLDMSVPIEATSQNLMSFANILEEE